MFDEELGLLKSVPWGYWFIAMLLIGIWINNDLLTIVGLIVSAWLLYLKFWKKKEGEQQYGGAS